MKAKGKVKSPQEIADEKNNWVLGKMAARLEVEGYTIIKVKDKE